MALIQVLVWMPALKYSQDALHEVYRLPVTSYKLFCQAVMNRRGWRRPQAVCTHACRLTHMIREVSLLPHLLRCVICLCLGGIIVGCGILYDCIAVGVAHFCFFHVPLGSLERDKLVPLDTPERNVTTACLAGKHRSASHGSPLKLTPGLKVQGT